MRLIRSALVALLLLSLAAVAKAQQTGELTGTVTDPTGAVLAEVTVSATNTGTHQVRTATSNTTGTFSLPYLLPGIYEVRATATGFKVDLHTNVEIQVGGIVRLDPHMTLGAVSEQVEVSTGEALLTTESVALGSVVGTKQITNLPLNGRDYLSLVQLSPNVVSEAPATGSASYQGGVRSAESISIAGQRLEFNHYTLDGVENTDPNFNSYIIHPSVDAIQEFKVQTGVYSAEFGKGASQINATTRAGTNAYHLVAFEFVRNSVFDAREWRQVGNKNPFTRNDYGFTLDGPISIPKLFNGHDRLFFMSNFESLRDQLTTQVISSTATLAMRSGDFSAPGIPQIYDPLSRTGSGATGKATPFAGNIIPRSRLSPQALTLLNFYPVPTTPGANLNGNFVRQAVSPTDETQFNQRIDFNESKNSSWFGRFSWENDTAVTAPAFSTDTSTANTTARQVVLANTRILSQSIVNEARFAWDQFHNDLLGPFANTTDVQSTLGISGLAAPGPSAYGIPLIGLGGGLSGFGGVTPWVTRDDLFQWTDGLSLVKGKHSLKVGGDLGRDRYNENGTLKATGEFDFDGQSTNNPANPGATGFIFADYMLGYPSQAYRVAQLANAQLRRTTYAAYVQDDWKITPRITMNLGLRYENSRPWHDKYTQLINAQVFTSGVSTAPTTAPFTTPVSTLTAGRQTPILTRPGSGSFYQGMAFQYANNQPIQVGDQYLGRALVNPNNKNFGPRIGINYSPSDKWSFRSGFGIFYAQDIGNAVFDMSRNLGGKDGSVIAATARTTDLSSPWSYEKASPLCPGFTGPCLTAPQIQANFQNNRTPYVEQYMANVQRQLTSNILLEVGYLGNQGHHINRDFIVNQAVPKTGPTDTSSVTSRRPFPSFGPIQENASFTNSTYNAGSFKLTQRVSHGLQYVVAFTWSRAIDGGSALRSNSGDTLWPTNTYNLAAERGPAQFNLPRRFVASALYELPFGPGKSLLSQGVVSHIVGGWRLGGILTFADGTSMNVGTLGDTAGLGTLTNQPDATGTSPIPTQRSAQHFWNVAAFNVTNPDLSWRPGNGRRNTLYTPGSSNFDASLARDIHLWESHVLDLRFEAFNATNHPNWKAPGADPRNAGTFGVVTSAHAMRQLQFAAKYSF